MTAAATATIDSRQAIIDFMTGFTTETTPGSAAKIPDYRDHLRPGTTVYITFLPGSDFNDTIAVTKRLQSEGFDPVPHFAARSIPNVRFFEDNLKRVTEECGVSRVLAIAGAVKHPVGDFTDSMQLLDTGLFDKYGIKTIGLAAHPEGSPDMSDEAIADALAWKNSFAERTDADCHLVTQFCFEAEPIIAWDKKLNQEGNRLPIDIGIPGVASLKSLLGHAKACGVGASMQVLTKQAKHIHKLLLVQTPDKQVRDLAEYKAADPDCGIRGLHMYPLGGLKRSAQWSYAVTDGHIETGAKKGFSPTIKLD
ncbi:MAG: methylenetetrahydrofolate reductase [Thiolinea sp.]